MLKQFDKGYKSQVLYLDLLNVTIQFVSQNVFLGVMAAIAIVMSAF